MRSLDFLAGGQILQQTSLAQWRWYMALWVAAAWLLSPLFVSTVLYVIQRMAQLATLFSLLGLLSYVIGRQQMAHRSRVGVALILASLMVCWPLATFSKENGAILPLLLFVTEVFWFRFQGTRKEIAFLRILFATTVGVPAVVVLATLIVSPDILLRGYISRDFTPVQRVLTEARVLIDYVRVLILPQGAGMGVYHDDFPLSHSLLSPPATAWSVAFWTALVIGAITFRKRKFAVAFYGLMFFLAAQFIESSFLPLEIYFEHRNYLPAVGIYVAFVVVMVTIAEATSRRIGLAILGFLAALPLLFAAATYQRVRAWQSWDTILLTSAEAHPASVRAHSDLASYYASKGDEKAAADQMDVVEQLSGAERSGPVLQRLIIHCWTHAPLGRKFSDEFSKVTKLDSDNYTVSTLSSLADLADAGECRDQFESLHLAATLKRWYAHSDVVGNKTLQRNLHYNMARILYNDGDTTGALAHLTDAIAILPHHMEAGILMLQYLTKSGDYRTASHLVRYLQGHDTGRVRIYSQVIDNYARVLLKLPNPAR